jgi:FdhD protein
MSIRDLQSPEAPKGVADVGHSVLKFRAHIPFEAADHLAVEEPLEIRLGGASFSVTMRTPGHDEELVAGLLFSERIVQGPNNVDVVAHYRDPEAAPGIGNVINVILKGDVHVARERLRRSLVTSSACGVCGKVTIDALTAGCPPVAFDGRLPASLFSRITGALESAQSTFRKTGGLHAAALFDLDGEMLVLREDIGRHNAVDKVIGHMLLADRLPLDRHVLLVSGRASFEIMQKAWMARIPVVAAVSAPSSMAVQMALAADMTLVGFVRPGGFNAYAGARRIVSAPETRGTTGSHTEVLDAKGA